MRSWSCVDVVGPPRRRTVRRDRGAAPRCAQMRNASTTPKAPSTTNTERHEKNGISAPATRKPAPAPTTSPLFTQPSTRPRTSAEKRSPTIDVTGGPPAAVTTPSAILAANRIAKVVAAAATPIATLQIAMLTTNSVIRRVRSVSTPIGMVASPPTMLNALASNPISPLPIENCGLQARARAAPRAVRSAASSASTHASANTAPRWAPPRAASPLASPRLVHASRHRRTDRHPVAPPSGCPFSGPATLGRATARCRAFRAPRSSGTPRGTRRLLSWDHQWSFFLFS